MFFFLSKCMVTKITHFLKKILKKINRIPRRNPWRHIEWISGKNPRSNSWRNLGRYVRRKSRRKLKRNSWEDPRMLSWLILDQNYRGIPQTAVPKEILVFLQEIFPECLSELLLGFFHQLLPGFLQEFLPGSLQELFPEFLQNSFRQFSSIPT